jgi:hypothetical protein
VNRRREDLNIRNDREVVEMAVNHADRNA